MRFSVSISATLGKAATTIANSLKRRRDDVDEGEPDDRGRRKRAVISDADMATSEVVHRFTVDSHPAPAVAEHESGLSPGGWNEFGLSAFSSSASPYPAKRSPRAPMLEPLTDVKHASLSTILSSAPEPDPPVPRSVVPPSMSTHAFESTLAHLNVRLVVKAERDTNLDEFRSASDSAYPPRLLNNTIVSIKGTAARARSHLAHEKKLELDRARAEYNAALKKLRQKKRRYMNAIVPRALPPAKPARSINHIFPNPSFAAPLFSKVGTRATATATAGITSTGGRSAQNVSDGAHPFKRPVPPHLHQRKSPFPAKRERPVDPRPNMNPNLCPRSDTRFQNSYYFCCPAGTALTYKKLCELGLRKSKAMTATNRGPRDTVLVQFSSLNGGTLFQSVSPRELAKRKFAMRCRLCEGSRGRSESWTTMCQMRQHFFQHSIVGP